MRDMNDRSIDLGPVEPMEDDGVIICRCEEVTKGEIRQAIHEGMFTLTEIKRFIRPGMGPCQGQRCQPLVKRILSRELGVPADQLQSLTSRPPVRPIAMGVLAKESIHPSEKEENHE